VRKLPSSYRLVVHEVPSSEPHLREKDYYVSLPEGAERIDPDAARKLIEGAEVMVLRSGSIPGIPAPGSLPEDQEETQKESVDEKQKHPHVRKIESQPVVPQGPNFRPSEPASERSASSPLVDRQDGGNSGPAPSPADDVAAPKPESGRSGQARGEPIDDRQKHPHVRKIESQLVLPQGAIFEAFKGPSGSHLLLAPALGSSPNVPPWPLWQKNAPLVPRFPWAAILHAADLSTPDRPAVPPELRGPPTPPDLLKQVLSREGYFCAIPGCRNMAEFGHHIVFRVHGGTTTITQLIAVCGDCHDAGIHQGYLLISGTAEKLIISGKDGMPIASGPDAFPPSVKLIVEPAPPSEPPAAAGAVEASPAETGRARESQPANAAPLVIPAEISPAWWLENRRYFEWSERQKVLIARFDREAPESPAVFEERPPAAPRALSTARHKRVPEFA
jgi:hypothetical protein